MEEQEASVRYVVPTRRELYAQTECSTMSPWPATSSAFGSACGMCCALSSRTSAVLQDYVITDWSRIAA